MKFGIDKFIGFWKSEDGYSLDISKISDTSAVVSFYHPSGEPIVRKYYNDKLTIQMPATYEEYDGKFIIELWETGKGFQLDLSYLNDFALNHQNEEILIPAITRNEKDHFLDKHYKLFGNLKNFIKIIINR